MGLEKLARSAEQVVRMQADLQALQPQLVATVAEVEALLGRIAYDRQMEVQPKVGANYWVPGTRLAGQGGRAVQLAAEMAGQSRR